MNMELREGVSLYQYQENLVNWMRQKRTFGVNCSRGGIVFAQMGLGKTFTSLEYIRRSKEKNNLIICSKILIGEWLKQIKKFYEVQPNILVLHSDYINLKNITHQQIANADIVITTYHMLSRANKISKDEKVSDRFFQLYEEGRIKRWEIHENTNRDFGKKYIKIHSIYNILWKNVIIDECQTATNWKTGFYQSIYSLRKKHIFGLSGTPIKNNKTEFIASLKLIGVHGFNTPKDWNKDYVSQRFFELFQKVDYETAQIELPNVIETRINIPLSTEQKNIYDQYINVLEDRLRSARMRDSYGDEMMLIMGLFTRLRQMCLDPYLLSLTKESVIQFEEIMKNQIHYEQIEADDDSWKEIDTGLKWENQKYNELVKIIDGVKERKEKVIIFSSFTQYLKQISDRMPHKNIMILSEDSIKNRMRKIEEWQDEFSDVDVLIMNYRLGAEGLNLTEGNNVILLDTWWNFTLEQQAIARVKRIGQTKQINVFRLLHENSIETLMLKTSESKVDIFEKLKENKYKKESFLSLNNLTSLIKKAQQINRQEIRQQQIINEDCPICLCKINKNITTSCGHSFCEECIKRWGQNHNNCPICRKNIRHEIH
jgi:SNF2 family DNA or RNA helicase